MPFPNLIAGLLIGIVCDEWGERLISPFAWGILFCIYSAIFERAKDNISTADKRSLNYKVKWGMSFRQAFFFVKYITATFTSFIFAMLAGAIKGIL